MEKEIGKIKKNEITDIVIRIDDFGGKVGLTIREYVKGDRYTGFTKAGTRISAENFPAFKDIIDSIDENEFKLGEEEKKEEKTVKETKPKRGKKKEEAAKAETAEEPVEGLEQQ
jgi:hypothetical protein